MIRSFPKPWCSAALAGVKSGHSVLLTPGRTDRPNRRRCGSMPSLIKLLVVLGLMVAIVYGGMITLVVMVQPEQREMQVRIPAERLQP